MLTLKFPTARDVWRVVRNVKLQMQTFKFSHPGTNCPHSHVISHFFLRTKPSNLPESSMGDGTRKLSFP